MSDADKTKGQGEQIGEATGATTGVATGIILGAGLTIATGGLAAPLVPILGVAGAKIGGFFGKQVDESNKR